MVTAILAVRNLFGDRHDIWAVNADDEYHEEGGLDVSTLSRATLALHATQPSVPMELPSLEEAGGGGR